MTAIRWQRAIATLCIASFLVTSCTSLQPVPVPGGQNPSTLPNVTVGDTVVVVTKTREKKTFKVTAVEADALVGTFVRVPYADMATLDIQHYRKGATTAVVLAVSFFILALIGTQQAGEAIGDAIDGT
jgi:ABC-type Fe3+-siderophore transport system permease subunit